MTTATVKTAAAKTAGRTGMTQQRPDLTRSRVERKAVRLRHDHQVTVPAAIDSRAKCSNY
ncbi:hypothetical protein ABZW30_30845 [Kitasatospora sp. NPDC004669]|uniref:hypothetical protein n=1 Tax=Kitasatospora sp. NPDC004669 TaxID=3154555 RepID=UPI0033A554D2